MSDFREPNALTVAIWTVLTNFVASAYYRRCVERLGLPGGERGNKTQRLRHKDE